LLFLDISMDVASSRLVPVIANTDAAMAAQNTHGWCTAGVTPNRSFPSSHVSPSGTTPSAITAVIRPR
jgi:hypothetical protein